jgi:hypothetical protein
VSHEFKGGTVQPDHIDRLPPPSEAPALSLVHQEDPSQLSLALSQTPRDSSSFTGLPPTLKSDSQGSYSPPQLSSSEHNVESRPITSTSKPGSKVRGKNTTSKTEATPVSAEEAPGLREDRTQSTNRQPQPAIKTHPGAKVEMNGKPLAEGILETNVKLSDKYQQLDVMPELAPIQDPRSYPLPSRATSRNPSRRPHQKAYFLAPTGSLYQSQASPSLLNHNTAPQHSRVLDSERAEYHPDSPPDWYIAPNAQPSELSANRATRHTIQHPGGRYYPPIPHVPNPSHETQPGVAEQIARFDQGSFIPLNSPSHTHQSFSNPLQRDWTGAPAYRPVANDTPSIIPRAQHPKRPESRRGQQRPNQTAESACGAPRMPSVSRGTSPVPQQGSNVQRPHSKQYRRQNPPSDSERSSRSAMGSVVNSRSRAYPLPSSHPHEQRPPPKRGAISQAKPSAEGSRRPSATVVLQDDPLAADGSESSSSVSSAALEELEPEIVARGRRLPHPGAVGTQTPESRKETTSRPPLPSIFVVPALTLSPPPPSLGGTKVGPPTSMADSRPTLRPTMKNKSESSRSAQWQAYSGQTQQSASRRPENSRQRLNEPSQTRQTVRASLDPNHRSPEPSLQQLEVPMRSAVPIPGLSRIGSSGSLREQSHAAKLRSEGEDSQSTSGYFTENGDDRTSDYSDNSDGPFDEGTGGPSLPPRTQIPQYASGDPCSKQSRHVEDERPPAPGYPPSRPDPRLDSIIRKPFPGPPPQQRPVDSVAIENGSEKRGRRSRSRSRMPGGFPGAA